MSAAAAPASAAQDPVEAVVGLYLDRAEGNPSLALRIAAAEALEVSVELEAVAAPPGVWEAVSAAIADAEAGSRPNLNRLLDAYARVEDASQAESLSPKARLADQIYRLGVRLCRDGCNHPRVS